jgi:hypothetical protein
MGVNHDKCLADLFLRGKMRGRAQFSPRGAMARKKSENVQKKSRVTKLGKKEKQCIQGITSKHKKSYASAEPLDQ